MNIYIGNLGDQMTETAISEMFEAFGSVESVKIIKDRFSGNSKGFGFVDMPNNSEADKAIKALNGKIIDKKPVKVNPADPGGKKKKKTVQKETVLKAFRQILSDAVRGKLESGISHETVLPLFREALAFSQTLISELEASGDSPKVACKSGCFLCCHSRVSVIPLEALLMAEFVVEEFSGPQEDALIDRIHRSRQLTQGKTAKQIYALKKDLPCVFLEGGRCAVYEARPSICRAWNSFDAADCRSAYDSSDSKASVASSPARRFVFGAARDLFQQLSQESLLQHDTLTLCNAMSDCFHSSAPLNCWARGDKIFHYV